MLDGVRALAPAIALAAWVASPAWAGDLFDSASELSAELTASDPLKRREAVEKLEAYAPKEAAPYVLQALSDDDLQVREKAAQLAGRHRLAEATPKLMALLGDPEPRLRAAAAEALGLAAPADAQVAAALERALADAEHEVRLQALAAFGRMEVARAKRAITALLARLDDDNATVRQRAAVVLGRLGERRAAISLIGRLGDGSREVRAAALEALGRLGDERAAAAILRLLRTEQPAEVQASAIQALGKLRTRAAVGPLEALLRHGSDAVRGHAALALGQIAAAPEGDDRAVRALVEALGRDNARAAAREALVVAGARAAPALLERLKRATGDELGALVDVLAEVNDGRATPLLVAELERARLPRERLIDALARAARAGDKRPVETLAALLLDPDAAVRRRAAQALLGAADTRATASLAQAVADGDREVRVAAIAELGRLKDRAATPALVRALEKGDGPTARAAARALGELGDPRAVGALVAALDRGEARVRQAAADALHRLGAAARPHLQRLLARARSGPAERRPEVLAALGAIARGKPDAVARELCLGLAESEDLAAATEAVAALAAMRDVAAIPRLTRLLERPRLPASLGRQVIWALGELRADPALLARHLDEDGDERTRAEAAWALGKLDPGRAASVTAALGRALKARSAAVRANAAAALYRLGRGAAARAALERLAKDGEPAARKNATLALRGGKAPRGGNFVVVRLVDFDGADLPDARYRLALPDGTTRLGWTDARGSVRDESLPPGGCAVELEAGERPEW